MSDPDLEKKLLQILEAEDDETPAEVSEAEVADAFPYLDEEARKKLAKLLVSEMKTPEEIEHAEKIAIHNAEVAKKRAEKLARREARRNHKRKK